MIHNGSAGTVRVNAPVAHPLWREPALKASNSVSELRRRARPSVGGRLCCAKRWESRSLLELERRQSSECSTVWTGESFPRPLWRESFEPCPDRGSGLDSVPRRRRREAGSLALQRDGHRQAFPSSCWFEARSGRGCGRPNAHERGTARGHTSSLHLAWR